LAEPWFPTTLFLNLQTIRNLLKNTLQARLQNRLSGVGSCMR
jgi:hypothetical protein